MVEDTSATARHRLREFYRLTSAAAIETNRPELCVEMNLKYQDLIRQQIPSSTKDTKDIFELGLAHNEAGIVHALNKEFDAALKSFQRCADVWSSLENSGGIKIGLPLCNTGMVHTVLKQDEASSSLVRAASNYALTLEDDGKRFSSYMYVRSSASSLESQASSNSISAGVRECTLRAETSNTAVGGSGVHPNSTVTPTRAGCPRSVKTIGV